MSGCNGICLALLINSPSILCLLYHVTSFSLNAWSYEVTEKCLFQGLSSSRKNILLLHNLCTSEIAYAVPVLS